MEPRKELGLNGGQFRGSAFQSSVCREPVSTFERGPRFSPEMHVIRMTGTRLLNSGFR